MKKIDQINEKLNLGRSKLKQIKERYDANSQKIKILIQEKAGLLADEIIESSPERKKKISDLNKELDSLKKNIESSGPELIDALEKKLREIESEKANEELRLSFERQKKAGAQIISLSAELINDLEASDTINSKLRKAWKEYAELAKLTKKSVFKNEDLTTMGSQGSLSFLLGILRYEYKEGKPRGRAEVPMRTLI